MNLDPVPPVALVVDDEPVARLMVKLALQNLGCAPVLEAADGIAAQQVLRERPDVALVLTDIMMPRMDGLELLRWGRQAVPDAMWIVLSGLETFDSAVAAIRLGAFDFLPKSPHSATLFDIAATAAPSVVYRSEYSVRAPVDHAASPSLTSTLTTASVPPRPCVRMTTVHLALPSDLPRLGRLGSVQA